MYDDGYEFLFFAEACREWVDKGANEARLVSVFVPGWAGVVTFAVKRERGGAHVGGSNGREGDSGRHDGLAVVVIS